MSTQTLSSVTNALRILRLYTDQQKELSFTEIQQLTQLPKSTTHRLITSLTNEGFLTRNPRNRKYRLGLTILRLGGVIFSHRELYKEALPIVQNLSQKLNESAHICFIENEEVTYLFRIESEHPDRLLTQIGRKNPIHCTSEGLCILAFQNEKMINKIINTPLYPYTPYTLTNADDLRECLETIKKDGYFVAKETYYENYTGIAAPIRDNTGLVVSSLSIIGHSARIKEKGVTMFTEQITRATTKISEQLGFYG